MLESISGHLSRRMLEHYSHVRIDAKRDALDAAKRAIAMRVPATGKRQTQPKSRPSSRSATTSRHSLVLRGSPPAAKLLIPLERRSACGR
ncbi:MAG: hypothetical protein ABI051_02405, partial [Vicinamibacterales bacterium]